MGFWTEMLDAGTGFFRTETATKEKDIIDIEDLEDSEIKDIIMIHPELLKVFLSVGNKAQQASIGFADISDASENKKTKGSNKFKSELDAMTKILKGESKNVINPKKDTQVKTQSEERVND